MSVYLHHLQNTNSTAEVGNIRDDDSIQHTDNNEIKVIFHVHLPERVKKYGQPVVLGDIKELGLWKIPDIKLFQPIPQNSTYWRSNPITILISNIEHDISYKYAIFRADSSSDKPESLSDKIGNYIS